MRHTSKKIRFATWRRGGPTLSGSPGMSNKVTEALSKLDLMVESASAAKGRGGGVATLAANGAFSTMKDELTDVFARAIQAAFPSLGSEFDVLVAACNNPANGDYQCNNAMPLFGRLKGLEGGPKNPRAVAEAIVANIPENSIIQETSLAGPGFINIKLDKGCPPA